jgi:hypothetical protein
VVELEQKEVGGKGLEAACAANLKRKRGYGKRQNNRERKMDLRCGSALDCNRQTKIKKGKEHNRNRQENETECLFV